MITSTAAWLERWRFMDRIGARWWPVLGAVYFVVAVKRARGMRLVGKLKMNRAAPAAAPAVVAQRHQRGGHVQQDVNG